MDPKNNPFMDPKNNPFAKSGFADMLKPFDVKGINMDELADAQQKNLDAITSANRTAVEGLQAIFTRQTEIVRNVAEEAQKQVGDMMAAGAPDDQINKQVELTKTSLEQTVTNIKEMAELVTKSQGEAFEILNSRLNDSLEELKANVKKAK
jgi:phasin family protein